MDPLAVAEKVFEGLKIAHALWERSKSGKTTGRRVAGRSQLRVTVLDVTLCDSYALCGFAGTRIVCQHKRAAYCMVSARLVGGGFHSHGAMAQCAHPFLLPFFLLPLLQPA